MSDKPAVGSFCWNELMTHNTQAAKHFYAELLGWESQDMPMGEDMTYTIFKNGVHEVAGLLQTPKGEEGLIPPHWLSYIYVENIETATEKAQSLGASLKTDIQTVEGMGRFVVLMDPTGAHVALWQPLS